MNADNAMRCHADRYPKLFLVTYPPTTSKVLHTCAASQPGVVTPAPSLGRFVWMKRACLSGLLGYLGFWVGGGAGEGFLETLSE